MKHLKKTSIYSLLVLSIVLIGISVIFIIHSRQNSIAKDMALKQNISRGIITQQCRNDEDVINNPNCFKIYSDVHLFGGDREVAEMRKNIKNNIKFTNIAYPSFRERTFYLGDIVDLANAKEKEKISALNFIEDLKCSAGVNYIRGNHEMDALGSIGDNRQTVYKRKILFVHGHTLRYLKDRADYWESGKSSEYKKGEWDKSRTLDEVFTEASKDAEKNNCNVVVFGHTHPDSLDVRTIHGIKMINVMKGCTYLTIPVDSVLPAQNN